mmetsp:Transcript_2898/g.6833  ORF Transcript_2898/g.6833 Transcript_2898/m.6833 type:complete len:287 (+) Transcript_2898:159-1019(+)|eukprot:CAMPEP_0116090866 /NCGR_PEP_ID=MMETSP0327-20121206/7198_1 /TAXON_ID=44447 /ORGANISM="Pseudo-nitzschia delicatissima, Strain B596" /LENGTH=286 /DNA_ID=CAMNT_0003582175 /DNA_START=133 /DNA_END=993 /DNA_ORIENTATION=-
MWSLGSSSADHQKLTNIVTGCSTSNHTEYLSHDANTWGLLQEARDLIRARHDENWRFKTSGNIPLSGMQVPFEVRINPKNGLRQVMVTRDIPEGYNLWKPIHYETFESEHEYVEFLEELPHHLQCEALSWTHPSYADKDLYVDITLDEGTFIQESSEEDDINIDVNCVSQREIKAGEFIYMKHTENLLSFTEESSSLPYDVSGIEWFDDIRSAAWKRTGLGMGRTTHQPTHQTQLEAPSIAPGVAILSALYLVAKVLTGKKTRNPSYHDNSPNGTFFCYASKTKFA